MLLLRSHIFFLNPNFPLFPLFETVSMRALSNILNKWIVSLASNFAKRQIGNSNPGLDWLTHPNTPDGAELRFLDTAESI